MNNGIYVFSRMVFTTNNTALVTRNCSLEWGGPSPTGPTSSQNPEKRREDRKRERDGEREERELPGNEQLIQYLVLKIIN